jgi:hypothetical protein
VPEGIAKERKRMSARSLLIAAVILTTVVVIAAVAWNRMQQNVVATGPGGVAIGNPTTQPVVIPPVTRPSNVVASTTEPASTEPTNASFYLQGLPPLGSPGTPPPAVTQLWFPPALLRLSSENGKVEAYLYSNDPPAAIDLSTYTGNMFYFNMPLDITDTASIGTAVWRHKVEMSAKDLVDSPDGIFLNGQKRHLYPVEVVANFSGTAPHITVELKGWFLLYDPPKLDMPAPLPTRVYVQGMLDATVVSK